MDRGIQRLNQRGLFFTLMAFLLIGIILAYTALNTQSGFQSSQNIAGISGLEGVKDLFENIKNTGLAFDTNGSPDLVRQRVLPFNYYFRENRVGLQQTLPIPNGKMELYVDVLNALRVLAEDTNTLHAFDGSITDVNVPANALWGGSANQLVFDVLPQCLQYFVLDSNAAGFSFLSAKHCTADYNTVSLKRVDINVSVSNPAGDFNAIACSMDGNSTCPKNDFNALNTLPYFDANMVLDACQKCALDQSMRTVKGHFDPAKTNTITLSCAGASCVSLPLTISLASGPGFTHNGVPVDLSFNLVFDQQVNGFYFHDANVLVKKPGLGVLKATQGDA